MSESVCERLKIAVQFIRKSGMARSYSAICRKAGLSIPSLNMSVMGHREPSLELILRLCDSYPINQKWLRTGEGPMIVPDIIPQIEKLYERIEKLERENELLKQSNPCL